jgi:arylsulfatase A-like enzyme
VDEVENVLFVSIDSLRTNYFIHDAETSTPTLKWIVSGGVYFDSVVTAAPFTVPSHVSMFSGLLPHNHGIRDRMEKIHQFEGSESIFTRLRGSGFDTRSLDSSPILENRGFEWNNIGKAYTQRVVLTNDYRHKVKTGDIHRLYGLPDNRAGETEVDVRIHRDVVELLLMWPKQTSSDDMEADHDREMSQEELNKIRDHLSSLGYT